MHCSWKRLLRRGLEFNVCTINKSAHTKKSENLFNDPRIFFLFVKIRRASPSSTRHFPFCRLFIGFCKCTHGDSHQFYYFILTAWHCDELRFQWNPWKLSFYLWRSRQSFKFISFFWLHFAIIDAHFTIMQRKHVYLFADFILN